MQELSIVSMVLIFSLSLLVILLDRPKNGRRNGTGYPGMPDLKTIYNMAQERYNQLGIDLARLEMQIAAHGYEENAPIALLRERDNMKDEQRKLEAILDSLNKEPPS